jgi:hypothetical protein
MTTVSLVKTLLSAGKPLGLGPDLVNIILEKTD